LYYALANGGNPSESPDLDFPTGIGPGFGSTSIGELGECSDHTISVTGSGTASLQADEATVTLGIQTEEESASEAVQLNAERMTDVIDEIRLLGITEDEMKTVAYSVYPVYGKYDYNTIVGYRVVNMIAVKITEIDMTGSVIDAAADSGANRIQGVSFELSDGSREELRKQAYLSALTNAEGKAELIAERLDLTLTGVLYVSESAYEPYQPYHGYVELLGADSSTPIIEGKLSVAVTVHIIYSFE
jgi:uncharacterized protein YggE